MMIPGDATFKPYVGPNKHKVGPGVKSPVNGRIFVLKFSSSSQRYLFWLQAQPRREPNQFSKVDIDLGERVNTLLQAEDVDYAAAVGVAGDEDDEDDYEEGGDGDAMMEDVDQTEDTNTGDNAGQNASSGSAQGGSSSGAAPGGGTSGGRA